MVFKCPIVKLYNNPNFTKKNFTFNFIIDNLNNFITFIIEIEKISKLHLSKDLFKDKISNWFSNLKIIDDKLILRVKGRRRMIFTNLNLQNLDLDKDYTISLEVSKIWNFEKKKWFYFLFT